MPLPLIPAVIGLASLVAGGYGVKKGFDAKEDLDRAKSIGYDAKERHEKAIASLEKERKKTNRHFVNLGKLKTQIFSHQIKLLVDEINKRKKSRSKLENYKESIEKLDLPHLEKMVLNSLEIETGLLSGATSGALAGLGAYGSVGMLASASTGTAIASLSGAAATNATLAWLGGGALSAGGLGMAGGTAILGGFVAGPAIAITGFMMASKAEEALTKARAYEADVDEKIAEIKGMQLILKGLQANTKEMTRTLQQLVPFFDEAANNLSSDEASFQRLLTIGRGLKDVLETSILEKDGSATKNLESKLHTKIRHAGILDYEG
jgi:hypothetical protein